MLSFTLNYPFVDASSRRHRASCDFLGCARGVGLAGIAHPAAGDGILAVAVVVAAAAASVGDAAP